MVRVHINIDKKIDKKFRDKFVRKKGDYSKKIEELMLNSLRTNRIERRLK